MVIPRFPWGIIQESQCKDRKPRQLGLTNQRRLDSIQRNYWDWVQVLRQQQKSNLYTDESMGTKAEFTKHYFRRSPSRAYNVTHERNFASQLHYGANRYTDEYRGHQQPAILFQYGHRVNKFEFKSANSVKLEQTYRVLRES